MRVFSGSTRIEAVAPDDRGLAYGDGLFETMRAARGEVPWWDAHCERLQAGVRRLGMVLPDIGLLRAEAAALLAGDDAVLKLIVTRGSDGRGYAPELTATPTSVLSRHPLPPTPPAAGIALRWCATRLALQPALAGIKHCNRLEQVLARAEWNDPAAADRDAFDGLMCSTEGDVVCATAANLFVLKNGRWSTPTVDRCGVAGVCRAWAKAALDAEETRLDVTDVETADAVFLCNAVRGILPVARLGARQWLPHPQVAALRAQLASNHPAFIA
ncbi:aminodeoxychorismate lyase [Lysobacter solisilvae (ex Woo and Kim 2020)]|uniref:Aminodeoxychorismate lyase n=1 Tax=Agrilutibacter terrestris TaxID=2865112 RepID=A0A7H0FY97_9GAMM|nr:aminodeoxychorismate lyase [Lysobacter terrestris]QNP41013.1 aminodeoxychorismate lyase [Lysobacter terrestris]